MIAIDKIVDATKEQPNLPLWLTHIWQRLYNHRRLGLILGAGVSIDAGCPSWETLVERLANRATAKATVVASHRAAGLSETYITQILYLFHKQQAAKGGPAVPPEYSDYQVDSTWREAVHDELFKDLSGKSFDDLLKRHTYLDALGKLASAACLTVNFNFDDLIDEATIRAAEAAKSEPPEIISRPKTEMRRDATVIYHINGMLPREKQRRRSDFLVFTEDAFAEVMISSNTPHSEFIMSRFSNTTFLLLGTSLNDNSLKNMLRAGINRNPANHHYIVYWEDASKPRSKEERDDIFDVNMSVYNLISIFFTTEEIKQFVEILNETDSAEFESMIIKLNPTVKTRRKYYLVGSVAAGKSSNLEALRCFSTVEEWRGRTPVELYQDHATLTSDQRAAIDTWIYGQLRAKNDIMRAAGPGIHVMDRAYLDLFAFSETDSENLTKANDLKSRVIYTSGQLESGQIVFLYADEKTLSTRQASRGKLKVPGGAIEYDGAKLVLQGEILRTVYSPSSESSFNTSERGCELTSRGIARLILLGKYDPFDFQQRIDTIEANGGKL